MKISTMDRDGTFKEWCDDPNGTHVPLPLDASAVPEKVVEQMLAVLFPYRHTVRGDHDMRVREAIAALAQALGEVGDE